MEDRAADQNQTTWPANRVEDNNNNSVNDNVNRNSNDYTGG